MNIIKKSNYLPVGAVVAITKIEMSKDWAFVGVVIHPVTLPKDQDVKGYHGELIGMPIVRTGDRYYRLSPDEQVIVLYEPNHSSEFKPSETVLYHVDKTSDY